MAEHTDPLVAQTGLDAEQRRLRAQLAAHASWAKTPDPEQRTTAARQAFNDRFEREVDPDGVLPEAERARRAEHARKSYYKALALRSVKARAARKAERGG